MSLIKTVFKSRFLVWFMLAIPAWQYVHELLYPGRYYPEMMENSGVLSVQLLVFTLCITPIALVLRASRVTKPIAKWLLTNRRYFGVAGFGYAFVHTVLYVRQTLDVNLIGLEALDWPLGTGWISLLILLPIALTSNAWAISKMGKAWKWLQRFSYIAIIAAFAHWLLLDFFIDNAMAWIIPLFIAKLVHLGFRLYQRKILSIPLIKTS